MPGIASSSAPGIARGGGHPAAEGDQRVVGAVDHQRSARAGSRKRGGAVAGRQDRRQLARGAGRVMAALEGGGGQLAQARLVVREAGRADHPEDAHEVLHVCVAAVGARRMQHAPDAQLRHARAAVAGGGHDRREREHALGPARWPWPGRSCRPSTRPSRGRARSRGGRAGQRRRRPCRRADRGSRSEAGHGAHDGGTGASISSSGPASRLSKRITWKPRSASASQSSRSQWISCMPRPITSRQRRVRRGRRSSRRRARSRWWLRAPLVHRTSVRAARRASLHDAHRKSKLLVRRKPGSLPSSSSLARCPRSKRQPLPNSWNDDPAALIVAKARARRARPASASPSVNVP